MQCAVRSWYCNWSVGSRGAQDNIRGNGLNDTTFAFSRPWSGHCGGRPWPSAETLRFSRILMSMDGVNITPPTVTTIKKNFFNGRKRSLRRLCFYTCLSFCPQGGVHAGIHPPPGKHAWADTSLCRHTPLPSACWDTQCPVHAGIDMATSADGMHPTGMHSCRFCIRVLIIQMHL